MIFSQIVENKHNKKGMTLIELMIVIAIIALIGAVGGPVLMNNLKKAKVNATKQTLKGVQQSIDLFQLDMGIFPERINDLVKKPAPSQYYEEDIIENWGGPYIKKIPTDGWKRKLKYRLTPDNKNPYELYSTGPSGKGKLNTDAISVWKQ